MLLIYELARQAKNGAAFILPGHLSIRTTNPATPEIPIDPEDFASTVFFQKVPNNSQTSGSSANDYCSVGLQHRERGAPTSVRVMICLKSDVSGK